METTLLPTFNVLCVALAYVVPYPCRRRRSFEAVIWSPTNTRLLLVSQVALFQLKFSCLKNV